MFNTAVILFISSLPIVLSALSVRHGHRTPRKDHLIGRDSQKYCSTSTTTTTITNTKYVAVTASGAATTSGSSTTSTVAPSTTNMTSTSTTVSTRSLTQGTTTSTSKSSTKSPIISDTESVSFDGCFYNVANTGLFSQKAKWSFTGSSLPAGLTSSDGPVTDVNDGSEAQFNHYFTPDNVVIANNYLQLLVPGGQDPETAGDEGISAAEIITDETNILYASVRMNAIFSTVPGTCHGLFFYASDNAEIDIEYLTDPESGANNGTPIPIWYTNQPLTEDVEPTQDIGPAPKDVTEKLHEYRIDWVKGKTRFYVDGILQKTFTTNVPDTPGMWVFNNWANGDPTWSVGPPVEDNILKIKDITMYYNTTTQTKCNGKN